MNCNHADYDNDGDLDVLLLRGGWETPRRPSLLRNEGDGPFTDVTIAAGLGEPIASQAAAWADYDGDGRVDLYIGGEYQPPEPRPAQPGQALPQQRRRHLHRRRRRGRCPERSLGQGRRLGRLR